MLTRNRNDAEEEAHGRIEELRQQAAEIMQAFYHMPVVAAALNRRAERGQGRPGPGPGGARRPVDPQSSDVAPSSRDAASPPRVLHAQSQNYEGLEVIDDDEQGDFLFGEEHPAARPQTNGAGTNRWGGAMQGAVLHREAENFPSLGGTGYAPAPPVIEPTPIQRHQPVPRPQPASQQNDADDSGDVQLSGDSGRDAALAAAFGVGSAVVESVAFKGLPPTYTPDAIKYARKVCFPDSAH